jgi:hypothetical protein
MLRSVNDVSDTARSIIATICHNSELVFRRLHDASDRLADYDFLVKELPARNVSTDASYQRRYNSFYVVRRNSSWRAHYYRLLQCKKGERKINFCDVIRELHGRTHRVEPSFSSKLIATIRPDLPTYDAEVCRHMNVSVPAPSMPAKERIRRLIIEYDRMINITECALKTPEFEALRKRFDHEFPLYKRFTNRKKLDLMLWQCRENDRSEANA